MSGGVLGTGGLYCHMLWYHCNLILYQKDFSGSMAPPEVLEYFFAMHLLSLIGSMFLQA